MHSNTPLLMADHISNGWWAWPLSGRLRLGGAPGALSFAGATRPCVSRACTSRRVPLAGLRCAISPGPRLTLFRPVSRPVCGFGVSGSASLCVA
jgi:hypothetical protein